jgi:hypothetical protein
MALRNDAIVRVANELNSGIAVLNGTTIGTLGSNTNGVTIETNNQPRNSVGILNSKFLNEIIWYAK